MTHWPFEVVDKDGSPLIKVSYLGDEKTFTPQEISAMVLSKMKEISEAKLGKTVKKAVVTSVYLPFFVPRRSLIFQLLVYLLTSTILSVWLPKTPVPLLVSRFCASSTNPPLLPLPTVLTPNHQQNETSSSSIWEEELSTFPSSISPVESSPSRLPQVTPTWVERTSITRS